MTKRTDQSKPLRKRDRRRKQKELAGRVDPVRAAKMSLVRRKGVTQLMLNRWRGVPFRWGKADCANLAAAHLRAMGHGAAMPKIRFYRDALGAKRALQDLGVERLPDYLDRVGTITRLPSAAFALPGDLVALPAEDSLGAVCIYLGNGACLGWHPDAEGCEVLVDVVQWEAAWRL